MNEFEQLNKRIDTLEETLQVILCCVLLPKDGPNWDYFEHLFRHAEKMVSASHSGLPLAQVVEKILNSRRGDEATTAQSEF